MSSPPPSPLYPLTLSQTPTCPRELHYCVTLPFTPWTVYYALFQVRQLQDLISKASPSVWAGLERAINSEMKKGKPFTPLIRCSAINLDMHGAGSGCAHVEVRSDAQCPCGPTAISWSVSFAQRATKPPQPAILLPTTAERHCGFEKSNWQRQALRTPALILRVLLSPSAVAR